MNMGIKSSNTASFLVLVSTLSGDFVSKQFCPNHSYDNHQICDIEES